MLRKRRKWILELPSRLIGEDELTWWVEGVLCVPDETWGLNDTLEGGLDAFYSLDEESPHDHRHFVHDARASPNHVGFACLLSAALWQQQRSVSSSSWVMRLWKYEWTKNFWKSYNLSAEIIELWGHRMGEYLKKWVFFAFLAWKFKYIFILILCTTTYYIVKWDLITLFENYSKCRIWIFTFGIFHQFMSY